MCQTEKCLFSRILLCTRANRERVEKSHAVNSLTSLNRNIGNIITNESVTVQLINLTSPFRFPGYASS